MPVENLNDQLKSKLDALAQVPDEYHFNSSAVWKKLEAYLQNPHKRKRSNFFVFAAASLLLVLSVLFFYNLSNQDKMASTLNVNKNQGDENGNPQSSVSNFSIPGKIEVPVLNLFPKKESPNVKQKQDIKRPQEILVNSETEISVPDVVIINEKKVDMSGDILTDKVISSQKPRFKIAHINEVNRNSVSFDIAAQAEKNNYGFTLRKEVSFSGGEEKDQSLTYPASKPKSLFNLINSQ
jgi:hypothetical protein